MIKPILLTLVLIIIGAASALAFRANTLDEELSFSYLSEQACIEIAHASIGYSSSFLVNKVNTSVLEMSETEAIALMREAYPDVQSDFTLQIAAIDIMYNQGEPWLQSVTKIHFESSRSGQIEGACISFFGFMGGKMKAFYMGYKSYDFHDRDSVLSVEDAMFFSNLSRINSTIGRFVTISRWERYKLAVTSIIK